MVDRLSEEPTDVVVSVGLDTQVAMACTRGAPTGNLKDIIQQGSERTNVTQAHNVRIRRRSANEETTPRKHSISSLFS